MNAVLDMHGLPVRVDHYTKYRMTNSGQLLSFSIDNTEYRYVSKRDFEKVPTLSNPLVSAFRGVNGLTDTVKWGYYSMDTLKSYLEGSMTLYQFVQKKYAQFEGAEVGDTVE